MRVHLCVLHFVPKGLKTSSNSGKSHVKIDIICVTAVEDSMCLTWQPVATCPSPDWRICPVYLLPEINIHPVFVSP